MVFGADRTNFSLYLSVIIVRIKKIFLKTVVIGIFITFSGKKTVSTQEIDLLSMFFESIPAI